MQVKECRRNVRRDTSSESEKENVLVLALKPNVFAKQQISGTTASENIDSAQGATQEVIINSPFLAVHSNAKEQSKEERT